MEKAIQMENVHTPWSSANASALPLKYRQIFSRFTGDRLHALHLQQGVGLQTGRMRDGRRFALLWILPDQAAVLR